MSAVNGFLGRVARRAHAGALGARFILLLFAAAGLYAAALLASRLLGILPPVFAPWTVALVPAAAALGALATVRRPAARDAARRADLALKTDDLFLTAALTGDAADGYAPLVRKSAEERAAAADPRKVVPLGPGRGVRAAAAALALLLAGTAWLPQLDPFGRAEERKRADDRRRKLEETRKATAMRADLLKKQPDAPKAKALEAELKNLQEAFRGMKPDKPEENLAKLQTFQKELGEEWRRLSEERLKDALQQAGPVQQFGGGDPKKAAEWRQQLKQGDLSGVKKELSDLAEEARKLAEKPPSAERDREARELQQKAKDLADFAAKELGIPSATALRRALEQLEMSKTEGLRKEGCEGAAESMDLAGMELDDLERAMKDLQTLEKALQTLQMAKRLNGEGKLDGAKGEGLEGIQDYAELYEKLLAQGEKGEGPGMGKNPGQGKGGKAEEDDSKKSDFKTEKSSSPLTAGKILLEWKTRELSDPGKAKEAYLESVRDVKQGVSEAILQEQVPPGYHEAIRKYFDNLEEEAKPVDGQPPR